MIDDISRLLTGEEMSPQFRRAEECVGQPEYAVVWINFLNWLRSRSEFRSGRSLILNPSVPWCNSMKRVIAMVDELDRLFEVRGERVDFRASVSEQEIREIENAVARLYKPMAIE